ncbi:MAG: class I SAM-dependent methyltransferase [Candidatus Micrarchaeota archaeon]
MAVYEEMAECYDLIYGDSADLGFYLTEARNARGPVLEVACGTGRILLAILREGLDAQGIDASEAMLDVLRTKAKGMGLAPKVMAADMRDFKIGSKFRLIIVPYRSFLHLPDTAARRQALSNMLDHLEKGGRLILHTYHPSEEEKLMTGDYHLFESERLRAPDGSDYELRWFLRYDPKNDEGHYKIVFEKGGKTREFTMDIRYAPEKEMRSLLKQCGFRNIRLYCGFEYSPPFEGCREMVWIAER